MSRTNIFSSAVKLILVMSLNFSIASAQELHKPVPARGTYLMYVGTYTDKSSKGIYLYEMDVASGAISPRGLVAETSQPSFLDVDPHGRFLVAANELGTYQGKSAGAVSSFSIDAKTGKLTSMMQRSSVGSGPCHIVLDATGRNALVASYGSGGLAVLPVQTDGSLGEATAFVQHEGKSIVAGRQDGPHAHCFTLDAANRFAFACDLGLDKIMIYSFDATKGTLTPNEPAFTAVKPGSGPRHFVFGAGGHFGYLINELSSTITVFSYDAKHGSLIEIQTVSTLPEDFKGSSACAEIVVHPSGKFLYGSNRGHDSIAVFAIDRKKGTLTFVEHQSTRGKTPRNFAIDPSGTHLIAANQDSNSLVSFAIDANSGKLTPTGLKLEVGSPACIKFFPEPLK